MKKVILSSVSLMFLLSCSTQDPANDAIPVSYTHLTLPTNREV